jgi:ATP-dependent helicase/nuclease subunit A
MNAPLAIPDELLRAQREASDPSLSAWVSANAGSGKTYVLAQRVIRLLLSGTPPGKILCLTFTKAAAANMSATVSETLARWTALDDDALAATIQTLTNERPSPAVRAAARRLFAQAIETPGGLKVQTIHAFCTRLLQQFPFEANVPARFAVLDEASQSQLLEELTFDVLLEGANAPDEPLGRALATVIASATDFTFREVLSEAIRKREALTGWIAHAGSIEAAVAQLSATLSIDPQESIEAIEREFFSGDLVAPSEWPMIAAALAQGSENDRRQGARFARLTTIAEAERADAYVAIFLTEGGNPRTTLVTKAIRDRHPAMFARLKAEQDRVCGLLARRSAATARDRTRALLTIASSIIYGYRAHKDRHGLLDYDDLITKTSDLLTRVDAAWVHFKLDLGIDHVLIDEAQDTSPRQWQVIEGLISEFAAGEGARGALDRTVFAVGDDKQSIFSFQGALPAAFADKRRNFKRVYEAAGLRFLTLEFKYSFRSAPIVLEAVDRVFRLPEAHRGLVADNVATVHAAVRRAAPGLVEIWPLIEPTKKPPAEGWDAPFDTTSETSPRVELARRIAASVASWIASGVAVGDGEQRHAATPGDFLILVRQRGPLFEAIIRALKDAGVAVAGADRLVLTEHIAVMDLLVLADALLLPDDDLTLATVLKSPLFGLDEDELFALAHGRHGSLIAALRTQAPARRAFAEALARLDRLAAAARHETPFAFYARVLGPEGGRRRFLARLGPEAIDALDEFLNIALDHERRETPSLPGFVAWMRSANAEIKRDMEISRDEVRVMTVHGAKGLEAPIVILADTTTLPAGPPQRQPRLLELVPKHAVPDAPNPLVWAGREEVQRVDEARLAMIQAAENEHRRLLYVAMTRAADRLIVCGATGVRSKPPGCWYDLIHDALLEGAAEEPADHGAGTVWRHRGGPLETAAKVAVADSARAVERPAWLDEPAPQEALPLRGLAPSAALAVDSAHGGPGVGSGAERRKALARGELVHRLLQALPGIPAEHRAEAARRHIARSPVQFSDEERESMIAQVQTVLADARFAALFAPHSRAEVPIVGRVVVAGRTVAVSGQVDRLAVTDAGVLIADYKTSRPPPRRLEDVPRAYVAQLALYRAVLAIIYPDRPIRAALIWTDVPDLMEISAQDLDRALAAVTTP